MWFYEVRGAHNRIVEMRRGFATEHEARFAGERAKQMIESIHAHYNGHEKLIVITGTMQQ